MYNDGSNNVAGKEMTRILTSSTLVAEIATGLVLKCTHMTRILTSSTLVAEVGEAPEVAEADAVAHAGEDELEFVGPVVPPRPEVSPGFADRPRVGGAGGEVFVVNEPATRRQDEKFWIRRVEFYSTASR
ncbi:hypothetical protein J6590_087245 [Homalodisca vitripennis]|nr:hypothetical protein J6590_083096 [Homalodisca vitripennis]KAG8334564.1 hypothetical protein J6590_087245 [Homalodisca vitripennis]